MPKTQVQPDLQAAFIDHDRLFKELLTVFFADFIDLLLPDVAQFMEADSITFLNNEVFANVASGDKHIVDILARARFRGEQTQFLLHVENQASRQTDFARRMFFYSTELARQHDLPVYPIALMTYDEPKTVEPSEYRVSFPGFETLHFQFRAIQLNRLNWRDFLDRTNPVAAALMSKMNIASEDRPKVKSECLRMLATLRLDPARSHLIAGFVDSYLKLNTSQQKQFAREIESLSREEQEAIVPLTISWKEEGRVEGRVEGRDEGRIEGQADGARRLLFLVGSVPLGEASSEVRQAIDRIKSIDHLERLARRLPTVKTWEELLTDA